MPPTTFTQKSILVVMGAAVAVAGGLIASLFRIDAFTGSDALAMEARILTRVNECQEETRHRLNEIRDTGRYHIERLDDHLENHGAE